MKFGDPAIVPVSELGDGIWLAHLSNGPTAAFKDLAMQLLGQLFEYELERRGQTLTILGATSGDTGSAAEYAMVGKPAVRVFMLSPAGRMSAFQQAQMFSVDDPHIVNIAVPGVFDDSQDLVKEVFADADFKARHAIGAVNSINIARLLAQVVYYVVSWLRVTTPTISRSRSACPAATSATSAPGTSRARWGCRWRGWCWRRTRTPCWTSSSAPASTGCAARRRRTRPPARRWTSARRRTSSASCSTSSDATRIGSVTCSDVSSAGRVSSTCPGPRSSRRSLSGTGSCPGRRRTPTGWSTIRRVSDSYGVVIDPHTADGVVVAAPLVGDEPMIVLETALPVKFAETIVEALGHAPDRPERFAGIEDLPRHVVELSGGADELKAIIEAHTVG